MYLKICPECGKEFPVYPDFHSLRNEHGEFVCSPKCSTAAWKREQQRIQEALAEEERLYLEAMRTKKPPNNRKAVQICDKQGNVIRRFNSICEASRETGWSVPMIHQVCNGVSRIVGDHTFRYDDPQYRKPYQPPKKRDRSYMCKKIVQLTLDGEFVALHPSGLEAAKAVGCSKGTIFNCCSGRLKKVKGFIFMRESEYNKEAGHAETV